MRPHCFTLTEEFSLDWNWPISREKYLKIDWSVKMALHRLIMGVQAPSDGLLDSFSSSPVKGRTPHVTNSN